MDYIRVLQFQISNTDDLKHLFILLLRTFNSSVQSKQYLQDLIVTNHILLLMCDEVAKFPEHIGNMKLMGHMEQYVLSNFRRSINFLTGNMWISYRFATVEIIHQYGFLLEDFHENGEFVNDCIFTMMHHIAGDLDQVAALFQPTILKTYSMIWETEYELCDVSVSFFYKEFFFSSDI